MIRIRHIALGVFAVFIWSGDFAQEKRNDEPGEMGMHDIADGLETRLEEMTLANEDVSTEDESYIQDIDFFSRHRIHLNTVEKETLEKLNILSPMQMDHFLNYRNLLGGFVSIYELQAVPGWDVATIRNLLPFVSIESVQRKLPLKSRLRSGEHTLLARHTRVFEPQEGYLRDGKDGRSFYAGSPDKYLIRYKFRSQNKLQYGVTAEKDPGEQFFAGHQKSGFDFYSAHFYLQDAGWIKTLAVGDFAVNFGQGLTQWQSLSFAGPGDAVLIKRQGNKISPYVSAGEVLFNRGIGMTASRRNWEATAYLSIRNLDASQNGDTLDVATSIRLSGLHRTPSEINGTSGLQQLGYGGNIQYSKRNFRIGLNSVHYHFAQPLERDDQLYRKFISPGSFASNYSVDYSLTYKNAHFFGEAAIDGQGDPAFINGMAFSANRYVDLGILQRFISEKYLALYGSAFTQSTGVTNENGLYLSMNVRPTDQIRLDVYADVFKFPWLKYRVDAPSTGSEYFAQLYYRPNRESEVYMRYRSTNKAINTTAGGHPLAIVENKNRQNIRIQANLKVSRLFVFRTRAEQVWYDKKGGFTMYGDVLYKPQLQKMSGNIRLQYFETDDYDTRVYAFENDVLYSYSIPMLYGHGFRYYLNIRYHLSKGVSLWVRLAQTRYLDREEIGSGLDKITGNKKTELKTELVWRF